jgi:hypothetical protein
MPNPSFPPKRQSASLIKKTYFIQVILSTSKCFKIKKNAPISSPIFFPRLKKTVDPPLLTQKLWRTPRYMYLKHYTFQPGKYITKPDAFF